MSYQTLKHAVSARLDIKKSEFIAYAYPVTSREQAMFHVEQLRVQHHQRRLWRRWRTQWHRRTTDIKRLTA